MSDLISRKAAIDAIEELTNRYFVRKAVLVMAQDAINNLPTAERAGKWIYLESIDAFECSVCGEQMVRNIFAYCPWCGARMEGKEDDNM